MCSGNLLGTSPKYLRNLSENSWTFPGHFWDISRKSSRIFPDISQTFPGRFQDIAQTCPRTKNEISSRCPSPAKIEKLQSWNFNSRGDSSVLALLVVVPFNALPRFCYVCVMFLLCFATLFLCFYYVLLCFCYVLLCFRSSWRFENGPAGWEEIILPYSPNTLRRTPNPGHTLPRPRNWGANA